MKIAISLALFLCTAFGYSQDKASSTLEEARTRWLRGNYAEATKLYQEAAGDAETAPQAQVGLAQVAWSEAKWDESVKILELALKKHPKDPDLQAHLAETYFQRGKWDEADKLADAAIATNDSHFLARWVKAKLLRDRGNLKEADITMRWFVRTYSRLDNEDKPIQVGEHLLLVGLAGAENARWHALSNQFKFILNELYPDALKFDKNLWQVEYEIGMLLLEKHNRPQAIEAFDKALAMNPKAASAYVGKGLVSLQEYKLQDAEQFAEMALKHQPGLPSALKLKADVSMIGGDFLSAAKMLKEATTFNPKDEEAYARLAAISRFTDHPEGIQRQIAIVDQFNAKPAVFYYVLARTLEDRKYYEDAEKYYRKSIELRDDLSAPQAGIGMLYLRLGKEKEAQVALNKAFELDRFHVRVSNSIRVMKHMESYETIETPHYIVRYDPANDRLLALFIADYLEEIHAELAKDFQFEPQEKVLFELFSSHEMFSGRTVGLPDLHTIGACTGRVVTMASPKAKGLLRTFNWGRVVRHELVHIFNLAQTNFLVPHWVTEGLAVRKEGSVRPPNWDVILRQRYLAKDLLNLDNITMGFVRPRSPSEWNLAYYQSYLYVEYFIKSFGIQNLGPLLDAYGAGLSTDAAITRVCKISKLEFERGYLEYVRKKVESINIAPSQANSAVAKTLEELIKEHEEKPEDLEIAAQLADMYQRRRKSQDAKEVVAKVLAKDNTHPLASVVLARLQRQDGDNDAALKTIEAAQKAHPNDGKLLLYLGRLYLEAEAFDKAAAMFERGLETAPVDAEWLPLLIEVYQKTKQQEKLADALARHIQQDADDLDSRLILTQLYLNQAKFPEAEEVAWDAIRIDVTNIKAQAGLLAALSTQKKDAELAKMKERFEKNN
ncbi:MAG: tetratricopeptide repeat protein [Zavarzinella sp.]